MPKSTRFLYLNGERMCHTNKSITITKYEPQNVAEGFLIEIRNYDPENSHIPCVAHEQFRGKVGWDAIALSKLSAVIIATSLMRMLGATSYEELLQIHAQEVQKHEEAQEILIQQRKNKSK